MDQRVEKTYADLQRSMRSLLGDRTWDQINVQALCSTAGVSRSTFYTHFKSKDDLLDSLLLQFEQAMSEVSNGRSIAGTGTFQFLPILLNHVRENRALFSKNNTLIEGYPVAIRFRQMIGRLVRAELDDGLGSNCPDEHFVHYVAGGIYAALVNWSTHTKDCLHLDLLREIDDLNQCVLQRCAGGH